MNIKKKPLGIIAQIANGITVLIELAVICRILPYEVIMGGMLADYETAVVVATANIGCNILIGLIIAVTSGLLQAPKIIRPCRIALTVLTVYFIINIALNMLGKTWLERILGSLLAIIEIVCFIGILRKNEIND